MSDQKAQTLSIVIPAYNEEDQLKNCLDSIAKQTVMPDEVIIVDNNSSDRTAEIAKSYPFVKVITEKKQGRIFAQVTGFDNVSSELIGRLDADSRISPDWVETAKNYMTKNQNVQAITGACTFYDFPAQKIVSKVHAVGYFGVQKILTGMEILWGSNMAIRSSAWEKAKPLCTLDPDIYEDIDLSLQLKKLNLKTARPLNLKVSVSLRRGNIGVRDNIRYLSGWPKIYWSNRLRFRAVILVFVVAFIVIATAPLVWLYKLIGHR